MDDVEIVRRALCAAENMLDDNAQRYSYQHAHRIALEGAREALDRIAWQLADTVGFGDTSESGIPVVKN